MAMYGRRRLPADPKQWTPEHASEWATEFYASQAVLYHIEEYKIAFNEIEIDTKAVLGEGGFGKVYSGTWNHNSVAVKFLKANDAKLKVTCSICDEDAERTTIMREAKMMFHLRNPNIVTFWGVSEDPQKENMVLVLERMKSTLLAVIEGNPNIPYEQRIKWISQTAAAFRYLHSLNPPVVHKDLKPDNILIDDRGNARVADFGLAKIQHESSKYVSKTGIQNHGAYMYAPPEVYDPNYKSQTSYDVYSFSFTAFQILSGELPFDSHFATYENVRAWVLENKRPERPDTGIQDECWNLLVRCWVMDALKRPNFVEIVEEIQSWGIAFPQEAFQQIAPPAEFSFSNSSRSTVQESQRIASSSGFLRVSGSRSNRLVVPSDPLIVNNDTEILWNLLSNNWRKEEGVTMINLKAFSKTSESKRIFEWDQSSGRLIAISFSDDNDGPKFDSKIPKDLGELSELRTL
ncbi:UNVERIFIED_CONTAM: hypothetical protein HDU68_012435 [Siphonaria sp. JEL0065]|nr:hypothetical protein HDU68_012435 [Siphonaria sp. JEL0065]